MTTVYTPTLSRTYSAVLKVANSNFYKLNRLPALEFYLLCLVLFSGVTGEPTFCKTYYFCSILFMGFLQQLTHIYRCSKLCGVSSSQIAVLLHVSTFFKAQ